VIVRDTSVAVSMARSAIPGCDKSDDSMFTVCNSLTDWRACRMARLRLMPDNARAGHLFRCRVACRRKKEMGNFPSARDLIPSEETKLRH
jgi:hypothetical protein